MGWPPSLSRQRAEAVVVLQPEPERVEAIMADGTTRLGAVLLHPLAERPTGIGGTILPQRRDLGRRRGRRRAEDLLQDPATALHRRSPIRVRGHGQDAGLGQEPAPRLACQADPTELLARDPRQSVMARQPLVQRT